MGTASAAVSIDRVRGLRRRTRPADDAGSTTPPVAHPLVGAVLGTFERRYGLMSSEEAVSIIEVVATSGDLAVADRLGFVAAMERRATIVVVEFDGWYVACAIDRALAADQLVALRQDSDPIRIMSIVSDRGITPSLGPLCA